MKDNGMGAASACSPIAFQQLLSTEGHFSDQLWNWGHWGNGFICTPDESPWLTTLLPVPLGTNTIFYYYSI